MPLLQHMTSDITERAVMVLALEKTKPIIAEKLARYAADEFTVAELQRILEQKSDPLMVRFGEHMKAKAQGMMDADTQQQIMRALLEALGEAEALKRSATSNPTGEA